GLVAKRRTSEWVANKRTGEWLKIKNWRYATVILTKFDKGNGYFTGAVYKDETLVDVVTFRHGLKDVDKKTLVTFFQKNGTKQAENLWIIAPSICVSIIC